MTQPAPSRGDTRDERDRTARRPRRPRRPAVAEEIASMDAWWRANNYLTVGQIYLQDNPLLRRPLTSDDIKPRLLGHWGTSPGLSFIYTHMSRVIRHTGQETIYLTGPGSRGACARRSGLPRGHLQRDLPRRVPRRGRRQAALPAVLGTRRHPEPRLRDDARVDPRGWGARLRPRARLRCGDGQPGPARARRRRRRRGRDGPARGLVEGHLLPQPRARRRGAADPAPQRPQDRRPDRARAQGPGRGAQPARGPRLRGARGRGR